MYEFLFLIIGVLLILKGLEGYSLILANNFWYWLIVKICDNIYYPTFVVSEIDNPELQYNGQNHQTEL